MQTACVDPGIDTAAENTAIDDQTKARSGSGNRANCHGVAAIADTHRRRSTKGADECGAFLGIFDAVIIFIIVRRAVILWRYCENDAAGDITCN